MSKRVYLKDSREKILEGVNLLADAVQSTLGPSGKTVIIKNDGEEAFVTKDGVTVAESLNSSDPVVDVGIQFIKKASSKMDEDSKDGTTTVTVICRKMIELGMNAQSNEKYNEHLFKTEMKRLLDKTIKQVQENSVKIGIQDIAKIATTSANNDVEIGLLFQKAFENSGLNGYINIVESVNGKSYVDIIKGYVVDLGFSEKRFANNPLTGFFQAKEAYIIIINNELTNKKEINKILKKYFGIAKKLPIVIIAKDFSKDVVSIVDYNNMDRNGIDICLIKNHLRNDEYLDLIEDISKFTGAEITHEFDEFDYIHGIAHDLIVKDGYTVFGEPKSESEKQIIFDFTDMLLEAAENEKSNFRSESLKKRASKMLNGVTTFYVGADSDLELKEKKHRVDDAYGSCKSALKYDIIMGGGQVLKMIAIDNLKNNSSFAEQVFYNAISAPFEQILKNSYHDDEEIRYIATELTHENGYNAKTRVFENLYESGVVDPVKVVIDALKNATSIAMTILSTECLIVDVPQNY